MRWLPCIKHGKTVLKGKGEHKGFITIICKPYWDTCLYTHKFIGTPLLFHRGQYWSGPSYAAITASTLPQGLCLWKGLFSRSTFVRSDDVAWEGLAGSFCSISLRQASQVPPQQSSTVHVHIDPASCTGMKSCWNSKGPSIIRSHKVGNINLSKMS